MKRQRVRATEPPRVGILGGSFDPFHEGHAALARAACRALALDHLYLVPAAIPPHKRTRRRAPARHRLAMTRLAASVLRREGFPVRVSAFEAASPRRISYTLSTVRHFQARHPAGTRFHLILGSDALDILPRWHRVEDLLRRVTVAVAGRPGAPLARQIARAAERLARRGVRATFATIPMTPHPARATAIRRAGIDTPDLAPAVARYARRHRLYRRRGRRAWRGTPGASSAAAEPEKTKRTAGAPGAGRRPASTAKPGTARSRPRRQMRGQRSRKRGGNFRSVQ